MVASGKMINASACTVEFYTMNNVIRVSDYGDRVTDSCKTPLSECRKLSR